METLVSGRVISRWFQGYSVWNIDISLSRRTASGQESTGPTRFLAFGDPMRHLGTVISKYTVESAISPYSLSLPPLRLLKTQVTGITSGISDRKLRGRTDFGIASLDEKLIGNRCNARAARFQSMQCPRFGAGKTVCRSSRVPTSNLCI